MNGLGEVFDGRYENILPKAGGGFLFGAVAGAGIYWAQKKGWGPKSTFGAATRSATTDVGK